MHRHSTSLQDTPDELTAAPENPERLPSPPALPRLESGILHWPARESAASRAATIAELVAEHLRALDTGNPLAAVRAVETLAELALGDIATLDGREPIRLVVGANSTWFRIKEGPMVDLRRRRASRLVFERLVEHRFCLPGEPVPAADLVAGGWPGETIRPSSAMSRLYVAILTLRNLGLRDAILAQDGGYLLDPAIDISRATR